MDIYETCAQQVMRALRGRRSQIAFSRRLGYRGNPVTDWENGRRSPTILEVVRAAALVGADVEGAFGAFTPLERDGRGPAVARWLDAVRGSLSVSEVARRVGRSRPAVSRWLAGGSVPRLPDFLRLVDAMTARLHDWVHQLVGIDAVPALGPRFERVEAARRLALERPWTEAIARVLETRGYLEHTDDSEGYIAARLGLPVADVSLLLDELEAAGMLERRGRTLRMVDSLTVDTAATRERLNVIRRHWAEVGRDRLDTHPETDWFAYNVISVTREDSERIEQRLRAAYREVRAIVAESRPEEVAALLTIHLVRW